MITKMVPSGGRGVEQPCAQFSAAGCGSKPRGGAQGSEGPAGSAMVPSIATMSTAPVTSSLSDLPSLVVAAAASANYTAVGVSKSDCQGQGQTLWLRNDLLAQ